MFEARELSQVTVSLRKHAKMRLTMASFFSSRRCIHGRRTGQSREEKKGMREGWAREKKLTELDDLGFDRVLDTELGADYWSSLTKSMNSLRNEKEETKESATRSKFDEARK